MIENNKLPENPVNTTSAIDIPKKKKILKLTLREKRLIKNLIDPKIKTKKEAGIKAGYKKKSATCIVSQKLSEPKFIAKLNQEFEKAGATDKYLTGVLFEGTKAVKVISANIINVNGEGMNDANSMTKDFIEVIDYKERREAAGDILKFKGYGKEGFNLEIDNSQKINNIQINFIKKEG